MPLTDDLHIYECNWGTESATIRVRAYDPSDLFWYAIGHLSEEGIPSPDDRPLLDRIDDTLLTYDAQHATGEQPWPYGSF